VLTATEARSADVKPISRLAPQPLIALFSNPILYGAFIPTVTLLNALVGILLPALMTPSVFGEYSLASTIFQYGLIFDCGTGQLSDRWIPAAIAREEYREAERLGQNLLWVRFYIGFIVFSLVAATLSALAFEHALPFSLTVGMLSALAGTLYMVSLGPGFIYRARSARRNYAFAIGTLSLGLVIARPAGMLAGGLTGSFLALALWYLVFVFFFHWRMPARLAFRPAPRTAFLLMLRGLPFFATSFVWAFYVTANRWFASRLMDAQLFGHFAFSANIYSLLIGAVGGLSAFYYPKIVGRIASEPAYALSGRLLSDLIRLTLAIGVTMAVGIVLAPTLIALIYPSYISSVASARVLLTAVPAMVLISWILPISLSSGRRPWIDGLLAYPAATLILYIAIRILSPMFGDIGTAAASIASALPLLLGLLAQLINARILRPADACLIFAATTAVTGGLCGLNWIVQGAVA
jgi:O-antigen/teichoic acid export membrane protein